jgi:hypothetical protein
VLIQSEQKLRGKHSCRVGCGSQIPLFVFILHNPYYYAVALMHFVQLATLTSDPDAQSLLELVDSLLGENETLRTSTIELQSMLDASRDEQSQLRSQLENRAAFATAQEDGDASSTLLSEVLTSPTFEHFHSPPDTDRTSWVPSIGTRSRSSGMSRSPGSSETSYLQRPEGSKVRRRKGDGPVKLHTQPGCRRAQSAGPASLDMSSYSTSRQDSVSLLCFVFLPKRSRN